jgi:hypothetical protein
MLVGNIGIESRQRLVKFMAMNCGNLNPYSALRSKRGEGSSLEKRIGAMLAESGIGSTR